jgi:ornithine carbamoyltransferase
MKHCISLRTFSAEEVQGLIRRAAEIKHAPERFSEALRGRWLLMLFQKTSTRTRLSFEIGIARLGGRSVVMDWQDSNFTISPIGYEARYVSLHTHLIMARLKHHADLLELARHSRVPVINGCDDRYHPCQALADLLTVFEMGGTFAGQTLTYVGIHNNVANSLAYACAKTGVHLILVTPEVNPPAHDEAMLAELERAGAIERTLDLKDAARRSQFVYTDTWIDMEFFQDPAYEEEKRRRIALLQPFQLNRENLAGGEPYILHDMPIHPGYEISEELVEHPRSLIYRQAENRLFAQQALMLYLLGQGDG